MATTPIEITRRRFIRGCGTVAGSALLGGALPKILPGPRAAYAEPPPTLELLTGGQVKPGMTIAMENVEVVKALLTPGDYEKVTRYGLQIPIQATTQPERLISSGWLEATEQNRGKAKLDDKGQLWTADGKLWLGGTPFHEPRNGLEVMWNSASLAWFDCADDWKYSFTEHLIKQGELYRSFEGWFIGIAMTGRVYSDPRPHYPGYEDELLRLLFVYTKPFDFRGAGFLTMKPYDQSRLERAYGYIPALRRVIQLATNQRWESPVGDDVYYCDLNLQNDPVLNWEWKLVETRAMLAPSVAEGYQPDLLPTVNGRFPRAKWELRPRVFVVDGVPKDPSCPYGRRRYYVDAVMMKPMSVDIYDRKGVLWRSVVTFLTRKEKDGRAFINVIHPHAMDLQADHVSYVIAGDPDKNFGGKVDDWWTEKALLRIAT